tara:strand:+ start:2313 stop:2591 length:279 start_codon:yes stop_codon:yes gene_type:complete
MAKYPGDAEVDRVVMENTKSYRAKHGRDEPLRGDEPEWLLASIKRVRAKLGPVGQPRPKARKEAAASLAKKKSAKRPQNPRMGQTKRKYGSY